MNGFNGRWPRIAVLMAAWGCAALATPAATTALQSSTPAAEATEKLWLDAVIPAANVPSAVPSTLIFFRIVWDEGAVARYQEETPGFGVNCVVSGEWGLRPDEDELVVRAGAPTATEPVPAGVETVLGAADCAILRQNVARDERNAGTGPVEFLALALIPDETPPPDVGVEPLELAPIGYVYAGNWSRTPEGPAGPIRVTLRGGTLAADAQWPEQTAVGDSLIVVTEGALALTPQGGAPLVEREVSWTSEAPAAISASEATLLKSGDSAQVQDGTTVSLRNPGVTPASWWMITVEPAEKLSATPNA